MKKTLISALENATGNLKPDDIGLEWLSFIKNNLGILPQEEFLRETAYKALQEPTFSAFRPQKFPPKPAKVIELEELQTRLHEARRKVRRQKAKDLEEEMDYFITDTPEVGDYLKAYNKVRSENYSNLYYLKDLQQYIPQDDYHTHKKLQARIRDFEIAEVER